MPVGVRDWIAGFPVCQFFLYHKDVEGVCEWAIEEGGGDEMGGPLW